MLLNKKTISLKFKKNQSNDFQNALLSMYASYYVAETGKYDANSLLSEVSHRLFGSKK